MPQETAVVEKYFKSKLILTHWITL